MANEHITVGGNSYEKAKTFKYLGSFLTNKILFPMKYSVDSKQEIHVIIQTLLSSRLLFKDLKIIKYKRTVLPDVLYGWEIRSLTFLDERKQKLFQSKNLKRIFGPKRDEYKTKTFLLVNNLVRKLRVSF